MRFGLGMPAMILYPPVMSRWEPGATGADIIRIAQKADDLGFDWLTVPEHIFIPNDMIEIMGPRFPEAMTAAAVLAGATKRVHMLTYILVLPYRDPVILAKQIATLDFLSNGRITLGTAAGHMEREFEVFHVPFRERGARTDEYLRAMKELWTNDRPSFKGRYVEFDDIVFEPKPVQKPHPPLLIGGNSDAAMRRAAALGDGWLPWLVKRAHLSEKLDFIREQPGFDASPSRPFEVIMPLAPLNVEDYTHKELGRTRAPKTRDAIIEEIGLLSDAGATGTLVAPPRTQGVDQFIDWMEWFAADVMPAGRGF
jgi:probable F420-dependent oxidoreductase